MKDDQTIEQALDRALDRVEEMFPGQGFLCAETVVRLVAELQGLASEDVSRMATGFCSGLARTGGPCGALMGAVLVISLLGERDRPASNEASQREPEGCYGRVQRVVDAFEREFGSRDCTTLCGCDLSTDEGRAAFKETGAIKLCRGYVRKAVRLALEAMGDRD